MQPFKLATGGMVCLLTLSLGATLAEAQTRGRRASQRDGDGVRGAVPRSAVMTPAGARRGRIVRAPRHSGVVRYAPVRPVVRYRSYGYRPSRYRSYGYPSYGYRSYRYRPGFSIGVHVGAPYGFYGPAYPYARAYPYAYPYAYPPAGYAYGAGVPYGGVRLDVQPRFAEVHVDGYFAGTVDDFDGTFQRLELEEGPHSIEIRAPGYQPATFDVNVLPGQTIRYRADLQPLP